MVPPGAVIVISQPLPQVNAVYGGLMTLRAQALGAVGVVIDGRVRDLGEHRALKFAVCHISPSSSQVILATRSTPWLNNNVNKHY